MPYTGIVLAFVGAHAAAFLILLGHWVASAGMFPKATRSFAEIYDTRPLRATLVGIFTYGLLIVVFLQNAKIHNGPLRFLVFAATFAALLIALVGSAGIALRIGRNLSASSDTWQQALRGGVMLALVLITPLLGSLFLLHIALASGFGAFLLAKPWKSSAGARVQDVPPPVPAAPLFT
ncbi:MAG: hypothetical protein ABJF10_22770 [Chthoniobacter sp.]|uniref:hypothetical protein n=1 Tax=Chthoniobacter sp. TaxID=2510640 RepID=UPI0032A632EA